MKRQLNLRDVIKNNIAVLPSMRFDDLVPAPEYRYFISSIPLDDNKKEWVSLQDRIAGIENTVTLSKEHWLFLPGNIVVPISARAAKRVRRICNIRRTSKRRRQLNQMRRARKRK